MIRVLLFDLGQTLVDDSGQPFPHVPEALTSLATFKTESGKPLLSCLVSDFTLSTAPVTATKVREIFQEYLTLLERSGLRPFFEPVNRRVTLSTHAGVGKPDRKIFAKALQRLRSTASLTECLFITENAAHVAAVRQKLGMKALRFGAPSTGMGDFNDWADAAGLIAQLVAPAHAGNLHAAVQARLAADGVELLDSQPAGTSGQVQVTGQVWHALGDPVLKELRDVRVALPVSGILTRGSRGEFRASTALKPTDEVVSEVKEFVRSLAARGQIATGAASKSRGISKPTHEIQAGPDGLPRLVRRGYSAL